MKNRSISLALGLFLVAPLVAEFLLGNMSIAHLGLLGILAPVYGGGALLIREFVRMTRRGWPSIFLLALAYGILEEAFLTQTLFNPNYLGQNLHLLRPAFIPLLGVGAWYTIFVLTLHTVWSISVPIALLEALAPARADSPWIGKAGIGVVATLFVLAGVSMGSFSVRMDARHFVASPVQFAWSAMVIFALLATAFLIPRRPAVLRAGAAPNPWIAAVGSFAFGSLFLSIPSEWNWWAVLAYLSLDVLAILAIGILSRRAGWGAIHRLSLAGGAAMAYAWHAFRQVPSLGDPDGVTKAGNLLFAVLAATLVAAGARSAASRRSQEPTAKS